ncbi:MAG: PH domain-containing protein [Patescibacteria group bacterium]
MNIFFSQDKVARTQTSNGVNEIKLLPEEKIILKLRKHWVILARDTIGTILLAFFPFLLLAITQIVLPSTLYFEGYLAYMAFATSLWLLILWLALAVIWTDYYLDLWIVTDKRIVSVDQVSLFNRKVTTLSHDRIQEITVKEENFVQAFFKYGTLDIETASPTDGDATMEGIPRPESVRATILHQMGK